MKIHSPAVLISFHGLLIKVRVHSVLRVFTAETRSLCLSCGRAVKIQPGIIILHPPAPRETIFDCLSRFHGTTRAVKYESINGLRVEKSEKIPCAGLPLSRAHIAILTNSRTYSPARR